MQQTLILFKPDAVQRRLCGRILTRLEDRGLKIVAMKLLKVTPELSKQHYAEHVSKPFYPQLEGFITSGPVLALIAEGPGAVQVVRDMMGKTNSRESAPGTIRGDFGLSRQVNLIHGSDSPESATREIAIYFRPEEIVSYESTLVEWTYADDEK
ncbi:nucleoside-diphosphate kinase [Planctomicrobium sp. SH527]|uniref:nucleoside-diphosphate kinase n=1 Tax=Planctomicrobium sp. SH527 TaxID=3448123 RepID=UPI003F5BD6FD